MICGFDNFNFNVVGWNNDNKGDSMGVSKNSIAIPAGRTFSYELDQRLLFGKCEDLRINFGLLERFCQQIGLEVGILLDWLAQETTRSTLMSMAGHCYTYRPSSVRVVSLQGLNLQVVVTAKALDELDRDIWGPSYSITLSVPSNDN